MKLAISVPSTGYCPIEFSFSFAALIGNIQTHGLNGEMPELDLNVVKGSVIHDSREKQVQQAIESGCTHLLFIDSDMIFEYEALSIMAERCEPVLFTNYLIKEQNPSEAKFVAKGFNNEEIKIKDTGLESINYSGLGFALFEVEALKKINAPRFLPGWSKKDKGYISEDAAFCGKLQQAGYPIMLDHNASKYLGHVGTRTWYYGDVNGK